MATRTTIEIFTRQRTVLHPPQGACIERCPVCAAHVLMIRLEHAAAILHTDSSAVDDLIACSILHAYATPPGATLICCNSLFALLNNSKSDNQTKIYE